MDRLPNNKNRSVQIHDFAMNPSPDVPRSQFNLSHGRKVPFSFSNLIPILCEFVLPGDTWNCGINVAARTAVPLVPVQDNWHLEYFSFFVPMRLVWNNSAKFFGEQTNPGDSISYTIPTCTSPVNGFTLSSLYDYMGLPIAGQTAVGNTITINALPLRCYNKIYDEWFRDENLQNSVVSSSGDGPDPSSWFSIYKRGKRFDYITQALPWPQKGNTAISIPLGTSAPVLGTGNSSTISLQQANTGAALGALLVANAGNALTSVNNGTGPGAQAVRFAAANQGLYADLTGATAATINSLRTSITLQQYLEKDARGGTRYTEYVWNMFHVRTADARLQRPEFIGGGHAPINTVPIAQTSGTGASGTTTPAGTLSATGYVGPGTAGFTYSATEHGYVLTLVSARTDITYSQNIRRMWKTSTRYDIPVPLLANLGEQTLYNYEVFSDGSAADNNAFGYVPRFDEYRFIPSQIVGIYRPGVAGNIAYWHSSQLFASLPTLNTTFIQDASDVVTQRNFSAGAASANQQILADFFFDIRVARALPLYGIPGLTRL